MTLTAQRVNADGTSAAAANTSNSGTTTPRRPGASAISSSSSSRVTTPARPATELPKLPKSRVSEFYDVTSTTTTPTASQKISHPLDFGTEDASSLSTNTGGGRVGGAGKTIPSAPAVAAAAASRLPPRPVSSTTTTTAATAATATRAAPTAAATLLPPATAATKTSPQPLELVGHNVHDHHDVDSSSPVLPLRKSSSSSISSSIPTHHGVVPNNSNSNTAAVELATTTAQERKAAAAATVESTITAATATATAAVSGISAPSSSLSVTSLSETTKKISSIETKSTAATSTKTDTTALPQTISPPPPPPPTPSLESNKALPQSTPSSTSRGGTPLACRLVDYFAVMVSREVEEGEDEEGDMEKGGKSGSGDGGDGDTSTTPTPTATNTTAPSAAFASKRWKIESPALDYATSAAHAPDGGWGGGRSARAAAAAAAAAATGNRGGGGGGSGDALDDWDMASGVYTALRHPDDSDEGEFGEVPLRAKTTTNGGSTSAAAGGGGGGGGGVDEGSLGLRRAARRRPFRRRVGALQYRFPSADHPGLPLEEAQISWFLFPNGIVPAQCRDRPPTRESMFLLSNVGGDAGTYGDKWYGVALTAYRREEETTTAEEGSGGGESAAAAGSSSNSNAFSSSSGNAAAAATAEAGGESLWWPVVLFMLSRYPCVPALQTVLESVYDVYDAGASSGLVVTTTGETPQPWCTLPDYLRALVFETPVPVRRSNLAIRIFLPGEIPARERVATFYLPPPDALPAAPFDVRGALLAPQGAFAPRALTALLAALTLNMRIVIIARSVQALAEVQESALALLFPLSWAGLAYYPVLAANIAGDVLGVSTLHSSRARTCSQLKSSVPVALLFWVQPTIF